MAELGALTLEACTLWKAVMISAGCNPCSAGWMLAAFQRQHGKDVELRAPHASMLNENPTQA